LSFPSFDRAPNVFSQAQKAFGDLLLSIRRAFSQRSAQRSYNHSHFPCVITIHPGLDVCDFSINSGPFGFQALQRKL
jgi:hypothetical protein